MEMPTIELIFVRYQTKVVISKFQLPFQKEPKDIENSESARFSIPEEIFKYDRYKNIMHIKLFDEKTTLINCANMTIYKGENIAYIFLEEKGKNIEMIFKNINNLSIEKKGIVFSKLDSIGTISRKRLTLINYDFSTITINKQIYDVHEMLFNNSNIKYNSFQISVFSLERNLYAVKPILDKEPFLLIGHLSEIKASIISKSKDFEKALDLNDIDIYKYTIKKIKRDNIRINKDIINNLIKMNLPVNYLEEIFSKNNWVNLDIYYHILVLNMIIYSKEEKLCNKSLIKKFLQLTKKFSEQLNENEVLKIYQKIQILINIFSILKYLKNEEEIESLNIRFFSFSEAKEKSIFFKVKQFYNELIPKITEESCVFHNLLCLNSGEGYHNHKPIYCFDMQNAHMIQEHLKELFPETLIFYNLNKSSTLAFNNFLGGGIAINEYKVIYEKFKVQNLDYINPCLLENSDDIAMNIVLTLFHEYCGHKKYHSCFLNTNEIVNSPKKYINESNKVIELKPISKSNLKEKNCDYVLTSKTNKKGDSGHFFELSFGKIHGKPIIPYLLTFNDNGKLLKRPDLFYAKTGETLRKYAELKQTCKSKNIPLNYDKNMSIEDEIKDMDDKTKSKVYKKQTEEEDDFEEEEGEISSFSIYGKKPKMQNDTELHSLNSENSISEDDNDESKSENNRSDSEDSECSDKSFKEFEAFEKRVAKKFNFTLDETIIQQIYAKFNDPDVTPQDQSDFLYLILNYSVVE